MKTEPKQCWEEGHVELSFTVYCLTRMRNEINYQGKGNVHKKIIKPVLPPYEDPSTPQSPAGRITLPSYAQGEVQDGRYKDTKLRLH